MVKVRRKKIKKKERNEMLRSGVLPNMKILFPVTKGVAPYRGVGMEVSGSHWSFSGS